MENQHYSDELEKAIGDELINQGIVFERIHQRLDFYLPEFDIYLEIKKYHSERSNSQLSSQDNVILIQGKKSVDFFIKLLRNSCPLVRA